MTDGGYSPTSMARRDREPVHPSGPRSIQGAATRLPLDDVNAIKNLIHPVEAWQREAWGFFDTVPELKFAGWWVGNIVSKVKIFAAALPADDPYGVPLPVDDPRTGISPQVAAQAKAEIARLGSATGGHPDLLREMAINFDFPGECYLIGWAQRKETRERPGLGPVTVDLPERWEVRSVDEVEVKDDARPGTSETPVKVKGSPNDREGVRLTPNDAAIRMWVRHPRWSHLPDSNMRALLGECRTLQVLSQQILAEGMSRQSAGILALPSTLSYGPTDPTQTDSDSEREDPFVRDLTIALTEPISDPSSASSVTPMVVRGQREDIAAIRHITFGRDQSDHLDKRIERRIDRIARGLNMPVEVVMGHMATTFANADQIDQDSFDDHIEPRVVSICDMLTFGFLVPNLLDTGTDPVQAQRIFVWFDPTAIVAEDDETEKAVAAYDRNELSAAGFRARLGVGEDEAPDIDEVMLRTVLKKGILTADLSRAMLEKFGGVTIPVEPIPQPADPDGGAPVGPPPEEAMMAILQAAATQFNGTRALAEMLGFRVPIETRGADPPSLPRGR